MLGTISISRDVFFFLVSPSLSILSSSVLKKSNEFGERSLFVSSSFESTSRACA